MDALDGCLVAGWTALHLAGFLAAWVSRWPLGRWATLLNQAVLAVAFLGITSVAVMHLSGSYQLSLLSASTLAGMALAAVLELGGPQEDPVLSEVMSSYDLPAAPSPGRPALR